MGTPIIPARHQSDLPLERLVQAYTPRETDMQVDALVVGAGPGGLATAIELARLAKQDGRALSIGVLEKAAALGQHNLSGAVVDPRALRELFPDLTDADFPFKEPVGKESVYFLTGKHAIPLPTPPTMRNHGNYTASICELVRWLGTRAEERGVDIFTGFPAESLLVDGNRIVGVRTAPSGLDRDGKPGSNYAEPTSLNAKVTVLAEGTRGPLTQAYLRWQGIGAQNPQLYALGVKELWEAKQPLDRIIHTMGWPLDRGTFGGSWAYPMGGNLISLGLVVGLDYPNANLDVHALLQRMKQHPLFQAHLKDGKLVEWGAKTIPEGGFYSLPARYHGDGVLMVGDAAGFVNVAALKGIHYAMQSGIFAARQAYAALQKDDVSADALKGYDDAVNASYITDDLYRTRNIRLAYKSGFIRGSLKAALMTLTGGRFPGWRIPVAADAEEAKHAGADVQVTPDGTTLSKVDAVFNAGNATRDSIPSHLITGEVPAEIARMYERLCPAGVYEFVDGKLTVNPSNCVDCKATDVLGPRWTPREGGSGPSYKRM